MKLNENENDKYKEITTSVLFAVGDCECKLKRLRKHLIIALVEEDYPVLKYIVYHSERIIAETKKESVKSYSSLKDEIIIYAIENKQINIIDYIYDELESITISSAILATCAKQENTEMLEYLICKTNSKKIEEDNIVAGLRVSVENNNKIFIKYICELFPKKAEKLVFLYAIKSQNMELVRYIVNEKKVIIAPIVLRKAIMINKITKNDEIKIYLANLLANDKTAMI